MPVAQTSPHSQHPYAPQLEAEAVGADATMAIDGGVSAGQSARSGITSAKARRSAKEIEGGEHPKAFYARQLMQPEWLTDMPPDLQHNWCGAHVILPCM